MGRPAEFLGANVANSPELFEHELGRLQNAVSHLQASNRDLAEAQQQGDSDPELEEALLVFTSCSLATIILSRLAS